MASDHEAVRVVAYAFAQSLRLAMGGTSEPSTSDPVWRGPGPEPCTCGDLDGPHYHQGARDGE